MTMYTCALCGKQYKTIEERNKCESNCLIKQAKDIELQREKEIQAEKEALNKKIQKELDSTCELLTQYIDKYDEAPNITFSIKDKNGTGIVFKDVFHKSSDDFFEDLLKSYRPITNKLMDDFFNRIR